jgi:hypothetical protein
MAEEWMESWLMRRKPELPRVFLRRLLAGGGGPAGVQELSRRGEEALKTALRSPGEDRERAFHLLAADAFLTYACEALTETEDVGSGLETLLARLGTEFS